MTILELLKEIRRFDGNLSREQNNRYYVLETKIENLKNEHEALKRDLARFFELHEIVNNCSLEERNEWCGLYDKLSKVGKEE